VKESGRGPHLFLKNRQHALGARLGVTGNAGLMDFLAPRGASQNVLLGPEQACAKLFARRANVHVDFHTNLHFNDLRCLPSH
jgi:hypothetical protein